MLKPYYLNHNDLLTSVKHKDQTTKGKAKENLEIKFTYRLIDALIQSPEINNQSMLCISNLQFVYTMTIADI